MHVLGYLEHFAPNDWFSLDVITWPWAEAVQNSEGSGDPAKMSQ